MSRSLELLTEIEPEREMRVTDNRARAAADGAATQSVIRSNTSDLYSEEMLRLVQGIFLSADANFPRQIVFCGVDGESGSSTVCASAGQTLAANNSQSVCLIEANVRSPRLSNILGVEETTAFSRKPVSLLEQCVKIDVNLWLAKPDLMTSNGRKLLPVDELRERLAKLREAFEYVLINAPGINGSGDAQLLGQVTDAAILVIEANRTRRLTARKAKETLDAAGVRLLGTVLNNRTFAIPEAIYRKL
jgi:Mrp family chromosome partitioning ATPase